MAEMVDLMDTDFGNVHLTEVKDIFVFQSFTGLSYAELRSLGPEDIRIGVDGKQWIGKFRQKTGGDETLPILPTALALIEKYKNHPVSLRRRKIFPVPSNVDYNRTLKVVATTKGYKVNLRSHKARYFFANVIMFDNGVSLKTIAATLGQNTTRSTEKYVKANKSHISRTMDEVEEKLYGTAGKTVKKEAPLSNEVKVIPLSRTR
jgi:integrase